MEAEALLNREIQPPPFVQIVSCEGNASVHTEAPVFKAEGIAYEWNGDNWSMKTAVETPWAPLELTPKEITINGATIPVEDQGSSGICNSCFEKAMSALS